MACSLKRKLKSKLSLKPKPAPPPPSQRSEVTSNFDQAQPSSSLAAGSSVGEAECASELAALPLRERLQMKRPRHQEQHQKNIPQLHEGHGVGTPAQLLAQRESKGAVREHMLGQDGDVAFAEVKLEGNSNKAEAIGISVKEERHEEMVVGLPRTAKAEASVDPDFEPGSFKSIRYTNAADSSNRQERPKRKSSSVRAPKSKDEEDIQLALALSASASASASAAAASSGETWSPSNADGFKYSLAWAKQKHAELRKVVARLDELEGRRKCLEKEIQEGKVYRRTQREREKERLLKSCHSEVIRPSQEEPLLTQEREARLDQLFPALPDPPPQDRKGGSRSDGDHCDSLWELACGCQGQSKSGFLTRHAGCDSKAVLAGMALLEGLRSGAGSSTSYVQLSKGSLLGSGVSFAKALKLEHEAPRLIASAFPRWRECLREIFWLAQPVLAEKLRELTDAVEVAATERRSLLGEEDHAVKMSILKFFCRALTTVMAEKAIGEPSAEGEGIVGAIDLTKDGSEESHAERERGDDGEEDSSSSSDFDAAQRTEEGSNDLDSHVHPSVGSPCGAAISSSTSQAVTEVDNSSVGDSDGSELGRSPHRAVPSGEQGCEESSAATASQGRVHGTDIDPDAKIERRGDTAEATVVASGVEEQDASAASAGAACARLPHRRSSQATSQVTVRKCKGSPATRPVHRSQQPLGEQVRAAVTACDSLHESILIYEAIHFAHIAQVVKDAGVKCTVKQLEQWLDQNGVTFLKTRPNRSSKK
ncbi:unnamed protein product [Chrysoparadoxa australica]